MSPRVPTLDEVFSPRGVAVVGASPTGRGFSTGVLASLRRAGFPAIYPINPKYPEVMGLPCYPSVKDVPGPVDHVVVSIPAESALALLDDCAAKGVRSVHFFTAGFSESGDAERADLEQAMLAKARSGGFRIIGPNCTGLFVPENRLTNAVPGLSVSPGLSLSPGPVAFISQSGGHAGNLLVYGSPRGLRFSKVISYGNALDVNESELLDYLSHDPRTEIIAVYIEGVHGGRRFVEVLREAAARKPVVVYKGGITNAGRRAAHGHTASLTSSVAAFDALCHQAGVIQVDNIDEMVDAIVALRFARPLPREGGVAVIGAGGGPTVLAGDEMERAGLQVPDLSPEVRDDLRGFLPLAGSIFGNPLDTPNMATPQAITGAMEVLSRVPEVDMLLYHLGFHPIGGFGNGRFAADEFLRPTLEALTRVREESGKPVLLALRPGIDLNAMKEFLTVQAAVVSAGFPVFHSLRSAAMTMARVISWNRRRQ